MNATVVTESTWKPLPSSPVRIVIADDHEVARAGIISLLRERRPDWEILGQASDGVTAQALTQALHPSILLLDLDMPGEDGLSVIRRLTHATPWLKIIVLSMHAGEFVAKRLRMAGAHGFLSKSDATKHICDAIETVLWSGSFYVTERAVHGNPDVAMYHPPARYVLTPREIEVFRLLAMGRVNKEIATELAISVRTVETHRASVLSKLHLESLGNLVSLAVKENLV